jgi:hypothetical protein
MKNVIKIYCLSKIIQIIQNYPKLSKLSKIIQNYPKLSKIIQNYPKLSKIHFFGYYIIHDIKIMIYQNKYAIKDYLNILYVRKNFQKKTLLTKNLKMCEQSFFSRTLFF